MIAICDLEFHFPRSDFRLAVPSLQIAKAERVAIIGPSELEVSALVWARSLLVTEAALPLVQGRAQ